MLGISSGKIHISLVVFSSCHFYLIELFDSLKKGYSICNQCNVEKLYYNILDSSMNRFSFLPKRRHFSLVWL